MNTKTYTKVTGSIFLVISIVHLLRAISGWSVMFGSWSVPVWFSWVGLIVAGFLGYQGLRK